MSDEKLTHPCVRLHVKHFLNKRSWFLQPSTDAISKRSHVSTRCVTLVLVQFSGNGVRLFNSVQEMPSFSVCSPAKLLGLHSCVCFVRLASRDHRLNTRRMVSKQRHS